MKRLSGLLIALILMIAPATVEGAVTTAGVLFSDRLDAQPGLVLRGTAVLRWMGLVKVYAGALYLPEGLPADRWREDVAKCLELVYFRPIKAEDFGPASDRILRRQLSDQEYAELAGRLRQFYQLFRKVDPGDRYRLTYIPGQGTELRLNDIILGRIPGADFARAYFGIWLGQAPLDSHFRDQLLQADSVTAGKD